MNGSRTDHDHHAVPQPTVNLANLGYLVLNAYPQVLEQSYGGVVALSSFQCANLTSKMDNKTELYSAIALSIDLARQLPQRWLVSWAPFSSALLFLCTAIISAWIIYQKFLHPLSKVPGPFLAGLTPLWWMLLVRLGRDHHLKSVRLHEKYGPLVRITPDEVLVADPKAFKIIYGAGNKYAKADWYKPLQKSKWDLTSERNEAIHSAQRRLVGKAYSMDAIKRLEVFVNDTIQQFMEIMERYDGNCMDLGEWLQLFAIDAMTEITFSRRFGFMSQGHDGGVLSRSQIYFGVITWITHMPQLATWLSKIPYLKDWIGLNIRNGEFRQLTAQKVLEHGQNMNTHSDILSSLEEVRNTKPDQFGENEMISMALSNVFAGSDTIATATRAIIWFLLTTPGYLDKFLGELKERQALGLIKTDIITYQEADSWPYLQAVMYEAMRVHCPFGTHMPRVVPPGGLDVNGIYLPAGTIVGSQPWAIHRIKEVYGEDVEVFRPERWLVPETRGEMQRFFFAFGGGSRTCIGRNIAWLEISKLVPTLFQRFDIHLSHPGRSLKTWNCNFVIQEGLEVTVRKRKSQ